MSTNQIRNAMKSKLGPGDRDHGGFTRKERRQNLNAGLAKMGITNRYAQANIDDWLNVGEITSDAKRLVAIRLKSDYDAQNPEDLDYVDLLMSEIAAIEGGIRPQQKPRILSVIPMAEFDFGSIRASIESAHISEDVKAALAAALAEADAGIELGKVVGAIWKFVHQMPRMRVTLVVKDPVTGANKVDEDGNTVTEVVPRFGVLSPKKNETGSLDEILAWRALKKDVRLRTALAVQGEAVVTPEWFCQALQQHFSKFPTFDPFTYKVNRTSGAITFVPGTIETTGEATAIDKLRAHVRTFAATLAMAGRTGLYFVDGLPTDKVQTVIDYATTLGFNARLIGADDAGIPGQVRIEQRPEGTEPPAGN